MRIFVVGRLGEVVKKVIELEEAIKLDPTNKILVAEVASYNEVLSMWPVLDSVALSQAIDSFRYCLKNLVHKEKELRDANNVMLFEVMTKNRYLQALDETRKLMAYISHLGQHIGDSPYLEVSDANAS